MAKIIEVTVPDIGDFKNVDVIEILVKPGDPPSRGNRWSLSSADALMSSA